MICVFQFLCLIPLINCAKVIIFVPGLSHNEILFNNRLGDLLVARGHNVTIYRPQYDFETTKNKPKTTLKEILYKAIRNETLYDEFRDQLKSAAFSSGIFGNINIGLVRKFRQLLLSGCETQIIDDSLMIKLKDAKFDIALAHEADLCSVEPYWIPLLMPAMLHQALDKLGLGVDLVLVKVKPMNDIFRRRHGKDFPDLWDLTSKSPVTFKNNEELIDSAENLEQKSIYIGGIGISNNKLADSWLKIMNQSKSGVVVVSFGSEVDTKRMPQKWKDSFLSAFGKFPSYTFLWKYDEKFADGSKLPNVVSSPFVPAEILAHPKTKSCISHGDTNALLQAAYRGIPLIIIPLHDDQISNVQTAQRLQIAVGLDKKDITAENIIRALTLILENETYYQTSQHLSKMLKKKPFKSEDLVIKWVEYITEFKDITNIESITSIKLNFLQSFYIDVLAATLFGFILWIYISYRFCLYCCCRCRKLIKQKERDKWE